MALVIDSLIDAHRRSLSHYSMRPSATEAWYITLAAHIRRTPSLRPDFHPAWLCSLGMEAGSPALRSLGSRASPSRSSASGSSVRSPGDVSVRHPGTELIGRPPVHPPSRPPADFSADINLHYVAVNFLLSPSLSTYPVNTRTCRR